MSDRIMNTRGNWTSRVGEKLMPELNLLALRTLLNQKRVRLYGSGMPFYPPTLLSVERAEDGQPVVRFAVQDRYSDSCWRGFQMRSGDLLDKVYALAGGKEEKHLRSLSIGEALEKISRQPMELSTAAISYELAWKWVGMKETNLKSR